MKTPNDAFLIKEVQVCNRAGDIAEIQFVSERYVHWGPYYLPKHLVGDFIAELRRTLEQEN